MLSIDMEVAKARHIPEALMISQSNTAALLAASVSSNQPMESPRIHTKGVDIHRPVSILKSGSPIASPIVTSKKVSFDIPPVITPPTRPRRSGIERVPTPKFSSGLHVSPSPLCFLCSLRF